MKNLQAPVFAASRREQIREFDAFMKRLKRDSTILAGLEVRRLLPYINAWSKQLKRDMKALDKAARRRHSSVAALAKPNHLQKLFRIVAGNTHSTVLSEIAVMPERLLNSQVRAGGNTSFAGRLVYEGRILSLGFIQTFDKKNKCSVAVPLFGFDDEMMERIEGMQPTGMLRAFQAVLTAGNHDMQHHYTNAVLNPAVADVPRELVSGGPEGRTLQDWYGAYFAGCRDPETGSYESWLMLNHARIRREMEKGEQGRTLKGHVDAFFDDLGRIGMEMAKSKQGKIKAHETVDYFGTALGYALMRFVPLDHPVMDHAFKRMKNIDPDPEIVTSHGRDVSRCIQRQAGYNGMKDENIGKTVANYKAKGFDLKPKNPDYEAVKKMQLVMLAPWMANLLGPSQPESRLEEVHQRVALINVDMVGTVASDYSYTPQAAKKKPADLKK